MKARVRVLTESCEWGLAAGRVCRVNVGSQSARIPHPRVLGLRQPIRLLAPRSGTKDPGVFADYDDTELEPQISVCRSQTGWFECRQAVSRSEVLPSEYCNPITT